MSFSVKSLALGCLQVAAAVAVPLEARCDNTASQLAKLNDSTKPLDALSVLRAAAMKNLKLEDQRLTPHGPKCNLKNAAVRKDWEDMPRSERKSFIEAVQCLREKLSAADPDFAKAARTRYDDLTAVHVNLTNFVHGTGSFLTWHRYFVWTFETALREECDYPGYMPYWNWFAHTDDLTKSPLFDGSETSIGGDGEFFKHNGSAAFFGNVPLPPANGGGCIESGPFKNITATIGPVAAGMSGMEPPVEDALNDYNPRCIRRDLNSQVASNFFTTPNLLNLTIGDASKTVETFQNEFNGRPQDNGFMGLHSAGHYTLNGENTDFFTSVNDPSFFFHHAMIDQIFWLWQSLHPEASRDVSGTVTMLNDPPMGNATAHDDLIMGEWNAPTRKIQELMGTMDGSPLCYIYA